MSRGGVVGGGSRWNRRQMPYRPAAAIAAALCAGALIGLVAVAKAADTRDYSCAITGGSVITVDHLSGSYNDTLDVVCESVDPSTNATRTYSGPATIAGTYDKGSGCSSPTPRITLSGTITLDGASAYSTIVLEANGSGTIALYPTAEAQSVGQVGSMGSVLGRFSAQTRDDPPLPAPTMCTGHGSLTWDPTGGKFSGGFGVALGVADTAGDNAGAAQGDAGQAPGDVLGDGQTEPLPQRVQQAADATTGDAMRVHESTVCILHRPNNPFGFESAQGKTLQGAGSFECYGHLDAHVAIVLRVCLQRAPLEGGGADGTYTSKNCQPGTYQFERARRGGHGVVERCNRPGERPRAFWRIQVNLDLFNSHTVDDHKRKVSSGSIHRCQ